MSEQNTVPTYDPYAVIRIGPYRNYLAARLLMTIGFQIITLAVSWQIYAMTKDPLSLGLIGLAEALPSIGIALYAGHVADRRNRRQIIITFLSVVLICSLTLWSFTRPELQLLTYWKTFPLYTVIFIIGLSRGFLTPAIFALQAQIVPRSLYSNAVTWNSTLWQIGAITGPALAGLLYGGYGAGFTYAVAVFSLAASLIAMFLIPNYPSPQYKKEETFDQSLMSGIRFVFSNQIILGALSLDLFAVLFGGAVALLPIFASEILFCGPQGLGMLRSAPAVGAVIMAMILAYVPPTRHAGRNLLVSVAAFGFCMIGFALSRNFYFSLLLLLLSGMFDNVSVVIRSTILQTLTPDEMRGRVSSVNSIFIGSSNEIGELESGIVAKLMKTVPSVIFGGCMTLLVVLLTQRLAPRLRKLDFRKLNEIGSA